MSFSDSLHSDRKLEACSRARSRIAQLMEFMVSAHLYLDHCSQLISLPTVSLGFFDDIFIPKDELQHPSRFEMSEQAWIWEYPVDDGEKHDLYIDVGETIKFRVIDEEFVESEPTGPPSSSDAAQATTSKQNENILPPYRIIGAINESGLGIESWWTQSEAVADDADEEEAEAEET